MIVTSSKKQIRSIKLFSENKLQNISTISPSASLRSIQAAENRLEASFSLSDLLLFPNLEYLTLRKNAVSRLTPLASPHKKLAALDFSKNEIQTLQNGTFEGLVALKWIDLANNKIQLFDKGKGSKLIINKIS